MLDITTYGKLTRSELLAELSDVSNTLAARLRELGSTTEDFNNEFYASYVRTPGNSVAAKEREANYQSLALLNELATIEAEVKALTVARDCLLAILPYAQAQ